MLTIPSVAGDIEQKEFSYFADGNEKWYSIPENTLAVSFKVKHVSTLQSNSTSRYLS